MKNKGLFLGQQLNPQLLDDPLHLLPYPNESYIFLSIIPILSSLLILPTAAAFFYPISPQSPYYPTCSQLILYSNQSTHGYYRQSLNLRISFWYPHPRQTKGQQHTDSARPQHKRQLWLKLMVKFTPPSANKGNSLKAMT